VKRFTVFVADVSEFCGKKSLRELGCAFPVAHCTVPLTCQQQIWLLPLQSSPFVWCCIGICCNF